MEHDDRFVNINQHIDAGDERLLHLKGQFNSYFCIFLSIFLIVADFFTREFSVKPTFFVKVPGRVNLIGEHVDYSGFPVCPMVSHSLCLHSRNLRRKLFSGNFSEHSAGCCHITTRRRHHPLEECSVEVQKLQMQHRPHQDRSAGGWNLPSLAQLLSVRRQRNPRLHPQDGRLPTSRLQRGGKREHPAGLWVVQFVGARLLISARHGFPLQLAAEQATAGDAVRIKRALHRDHWRWNGSSDRFPRHQGMCAVHRIQSGARHADPAAARCCFRHCELTFRSEQGSDQRFQPASD